MQNSVMEIIRAIFKNFFKVCLQPSLPLDDFDFLKILSLDVVINIFRLYKTILDLLQYVLACGNDNNSNLFLGDC